MGTAKDGASTWKFDLALALLAALAAVAVSTYSGFPQLANAHGDNDSLLQLVQVRDLLAGQGWFDMHQYRMGPEGGFIMHWSRLLDAPLALAMLGASALTGNMALAEKIVQVAWPALQFWLSVFFIIRAARNFAGERAVVPAIVVGGAALYYLGIFSPGALDHHNIQLMLTLASLSLLLDAPTRGWAALPSGICAALTMAIGMESAPYAGTLGVLVALLFLAGGAGERLIARDFGLGFAGVCAVVFATTVPVSAWGQAQCDTFSVVQFVVAAIGGAGLAAIATIEATNRTRKRRVMSLGLLALVLGVVVVVMFPQCLAMPYANLDPRIKTLWLDHIDEAQSLYKLIFANPARVAARYATPLLAIILMAVRLRRGGWRRQDSIVGALLVVAFIVSTWEVRASTFSIAFAVIPLSAWITKWRQRAETSSSRGVALKMAAVWLVSVNAVWTGAAAAASLAFEADKPAAYHGDVDATCESKATFTMLGQQPQTTVLAISNLGSPILAYTQNRVFAGPYHRNIAGNLLALDAFMGSAAAARTIARDHHVGLVAVCRGNPETRLLTAKAPEGFLAGLAGGSVPEWLEPIAQTQGSQLELYRVLPGS